MACLNLTDSDAGFATPAATMVSLALAMIASAVTASSIAELGSARADLERARQDLALDASQQAASFALLTARQDERLRWTTAGPSGPVSVLAEPEDPKTSLAGAAAHGGEPFIRLGVADPGALQNRLRALASSPAAEFQLEEADSATLWRACARSAISPYGKAETFVPTKAAAPVTGAISWRVGETWRLRVVNQGGWADDRIVRFTGDPNHPVAVVERRLERSGRGGEACEQAFAIETKG